MPVISIIPKKTVGIDFQRVTADFLQSEELANGSGQVIPAGSVVRLIDPTCTSNCEITPAKADSVSNARAIGILRNAAMPGQLVNVTINGATNYYLEPGEAAPASGTFLYLSSTTAGAVTATEPDVSTSAVVAIGKAMVGKVVLDIERQIGIADINQIPASTVWVKDGDDYYPAAVTIGHTGLWALSFDSGTVDIFPYQTTLPDTYWTYPAGSDIYIGDS